MIELIIKILNKYLCFEKLKFNLLSWTVLFAKFTFSFELPVESVFNAILDDKLKFHLSFLNTENKLQ